MNALPCYMTLSILLLASHDAAVADGRKCDPSTLLAGGISTAVGAVVPSGQPATGLLPASAAPAAAIPGSGGGTLQRRVNELEDIVRKQNQLIELQNKKISELEHRR